MLAKRIDELPADRTWIFEPKWDGFCALIFRDRNSSGDLFIADSGNNRVLCFDQPLVTPTPSQSPSGTPTKSASPTPSATLTGTTGTTTSSASPTPIAKLTVAPATLKFGTETASVASKAQPVTLTNTSRATAYVGQLAIAANSDFTLIADLCRARR
jgi:hypothetical protein